MLTNKISLQLRQATTDDCSDIMNIIDNAIAEMKRQHREQWQDGYPALSNITADINNRNGYVLCHGMKIIAYCALIFSGEKAYDNLTDGTWLTPHQSTRNCNYVVIHRMAVDKSLWGKHIGEKFFNMLFDYAKSKGSESCRIDTNFDNGAMLHILEKLNFTYCGKVFYAAERLAFELVFN